MFAKDCGIVEDPATGSASGSLAAFMKARDLVRSGNGTRFISEQRTRCEDAASKLGLTKSGRTLHAACAETIAPSVTV
jgi:predicted PhzF superfamily epimerase YddE/YHI9